MTEAEWLACTDPQRMLEFLRGKASERKLRLFAVACCHRVWHLLTDTRSRQAVEFGEQYVDGEVKESRRAAHQKTAWDAYADWSKRKTRGAAASVMLHKEQRVSGHSTAGGTPLGRHRSARS
jgi:hypothetical protein